MSYHKADKRTLQQIGKQKAERREKTDNCASCCFVKILGVAVHSIQLHRRYQTLRK